MKKRNLLRSRAPLALALGLALFGAAESDQRTLVAPDMRVSVDSSSSHAEMIAAADPRDRNALLGAAIVDSSQTHIYTSTDGGGTWSTSVLPETRGATAGDPQVGYGADGTAYFATLSTVHDNDAVLVSRSTDLGRTWSAAVALDPSESYDHEQLAADWYSKRFRNRVYLTALYGASDYSIGIWHSADSGKTWGRRALVWSMHGYGIDEVTPVVLSDGSLIVFAVDFSISNSSQPRFTNIWAIESHDGGEHFGKPRKIARQYALTDAEVERLREAGTFALPTFPAFASDPNPSSAYCDRVYGVFTDYRGGRARVYFLRSLDRGKTWSKPAPIPGSGAQGAQQFQPALAVNSKGEIAVTWFDTEGSHNSYREYAAISSDGGATFDSPRALSSAKSDPANAGNVAFAAAAFERLANGHIGVSFVSSFSRWPMGGDYMGLVADASGTFHALWADGRDYATQAWTASFRLGVLPSVPRVNSADVSSDVGLVFGPRDYDPRKRMFSYAVRLKNISSHAIYGPITATISNVQNPYFVAHHESHAFDVPRIYGATNGLHGVGAAFSYANALGDFPFLGPGETSGAVTWMFSVPLSSRPYLGVQIEGFKSAP